MTYLPLDLDNASVTHVHIIGIGGAGMSAIATVLNKMGKKVTGSDLKQSHVTERLISQGMTVQVPHSTECINDTLDIVVRSSAITDDNIEVVAARELGVPVFSRSELLSAICAREKSIGIAGSHGKTTTTSMVTSIARSAGLNPSFMIGGDVNEIGTNAGYNVDSMMIVEADESDRTFLALPLVGAIITNVETDHLENYNDSFDELKNSFYDFGKAVNGPLVMCVDEPNARVIAEKLRTERDVTTVGTNDADWTYLITDTSRGGITADISFRGASRGVLQLAVPGAHNVRNALCALALMSTFDVSDEDCLKGLSSFGGVARRFQFRGETNGITFVDDYAHLPSEISVTLDAANDGDFRRVIAIFQPHRFSRTQALYKECAVALMTADIIAVCDVYPAGEDPRPGITGALITDELISAGHESVYFVRHIDEVILFIQSHAQPGDVVLTLGAGDVTMYSDVIQDALRKSV